MEKIKKVIRDSLKELKIGEVDFVVVRDGVSLHCPSQS